MEIHNVTETSFSTPSTKSSMRSNGRGKATDPALLPMPLDTACYTLNRLTPRYVCPAAASPGETDSIEGSSRGRRRLPGARGAPKDRPLQTAHFEHQGRKEGPRLAEGPVSTFPP
jgi:hypothetical protein